MRNTLAIMAVLAAIPAFAEPVTGKAAKKLLFPVKGVEVELLEGSGLAKDQAVVLGMVAEGQPYFGAIAISPDDGLMSEATVAAANHHDTDAASAAALADCNARKTGKSACVVVALIRPKGWELRALQMSLAATTGFRADYPARAGAMALSPSSGAWGIGAGEGAADAALAACAATAKDCALAVID